MSADELRAQRREYQRRYREANRDEINRKQRQLWHANPQWPCRSPEKRREYEKRRRLRLEALGLTRKYDPETYDSQARMAGHWFRRFGLTPEQYLALLEAQGDRCAVCRQPETIVNNGKPQALAIDHDHATGVVRGLLCGRCNRGIGAFRENPDALLAAAEYLRCPAR